MPDRPAFDPLGAALPDADPRLPGALAERVRALPAPDPGDAYFETLAARVAARTGRRPAAARPPQPLRRTRRAWASAGATALAACVVVALAWMLRLPDGPFGQGEPVAQAVRGGAAPVPTDAAPVPSVAVPSVAVPSGDAAPPAPGRPGVSRGTAPVRRAAPMPRGQADPFAAPRRAPRLASATGIETGQGGFALVSADLPQRAADAEGALLLRRAQLVVLALQNADRPEDIALLSPLAGPLADDLVRWRTHAASDPALSASADALEPVLIGLSALAAADTLGARRLRDAARRADLTLHVDRALLAFSALPSDAP